MAGFFTWLNAINDQVAGLGAVLVPGTVRDSLYVLDCLLNLDGGVRPEMVTTDTASYSDIVFGLFRLLGYQFCPRIADLTDQRLWRIDPHAHYGPLDPVTRHKVNTGRIATHWEDMLRMVGRDGHATRLSPLGDQQLNVHGRYAFTPLGLPIGGLRPLRDPAAAVDEGRRMSVAIAGASSVSPPGTSGEGVPAGGVRLVCLVGTCD